jgi:uncharacterized protein with PQ loop repeat
MHAMTGLQVAESFAYLGAAFGVIMVVPQIVRIVRHPTLTGVSPVSWAFTAYGCLTWMTFGIRHNATPQIPGNILLAMGAVVCVLLVNTPMPRGRRLALFVAGAAVLMVIDWTIPPETVGYFATCVGTFSMWPQLYDSVGNWRGHVNSGVSLSTWWLRLGAQVGWLYYAFFTRDLPIILGGTLAISVAAVMLVLETAARSGVELVPELDLQPEFA